MRAVPVRHAVRREHDARHVAGRGDDLPDRAIDGAIHRAHRIAGNRQHRAVVSRMTGVVQVPALMPNAVRLAEHLHEEIPAAAPQELHRPRRLATHARFEGQDELAIVSCAVPVGVARGTCRMPAPVRCDPRGQLGRRGRESEEGIVSAPLDHLDAIQSFALRRRERDIEQRDALPGAGERAPERLALDEGAAGAIGDAIGARDQLHLIVEAMLRRIRTGEQRRPRGSHEKALEPAGASGQAACGEHGQVRQRAVGDKFVEQVRARGIEAYHQEASVAVGHRSRPSVSRTRWRMKGAYRHPDCSSTLRTCQRQAAPNAPTSRS